LAKRKAIRGTCIPWKRVLTFLDVLPPWQTLCAQVEERTDVISENTRRVMTAAVGVCFHNYDFPNNVHHVLEMIGSGVAKPFHWHGHVAPARWVAINTMIVAIQGWLWKRSPVTLSRTFGVKQKDLSRIIRIIGPGRTPVKEAMLRRLLWNIIDNTVHNTRLGIVGNCEEVPDEEITYPDFSDAYLYDERRHYYELRVEEQPMRTVEEVIERAGQSGSAFLSYVKTPLPPFCQQKMLRYQEVALFRISRLWTEPFANPPGGVPRSYYEDLYKAYEQAIGHWYEGQPTAAVVNHREVFETVWELLGERTERKRALLDCLIFRSKPAQDLQEAAFYWLKDQAHTARK
jgi:hypothetical protein